jgi:hypothetical protein
MSPSEIGALRFQTSPISISAIRYIMPLGHITPSSFGPSLPETFIYFYFVDPDAGESPSAQRTVVFAPGGGMVNFVGGTGVDSVPATGQMEVVATGSMLYLLGSFVPDAQIVAGQTIVAGQRVGVTGTNPAVTLQLASYSGSPSAVPRIVLGYEAPLRYFEGAVGSQLYGKVQRLGADLDGKFDYNVAGRLSGTWYVEGTLLPYPLCFAYDTYDPSQPRISLGVPVGPDGVFAIGSGEPDPGTVSVASGLVRYTLTTSRTGLPINGGPGGTLLVQMLTDTEIRAQWFADGTSASSFTSTAHTLERTHCVPASLPPC